MSSSSIADQAVKRSRNVMSDDEEEQIIEGTNVPFPLKDAAIPKSNATKRVEWSVPNLIPLSGILTLTGVCKLFSRLFHLISLEMSHLSAPGYTDLNAADYTTLYNTYIYGQIMLCMCWLLSVDCINSHSLYGLLAPATKSTFKGVKILPLSPTTRCLMACFVAYLEGSCKPRHVAIPFTTEGAYNHVVIMNRVKAYVSDILSTFNVNHVLPGGSIYFNDKGENYVYYYYNVLFTREGFITYYVAGATAAAPRVPVYVPIPGMVPLSTLFGRFRAKFNLSPLVFTQTLCTENNSLALCAYVQPVSAATVPSPVFTGILWIEEKETVYVMNAILLPEFTRNVMRIQDTDEIANDIQEVVEDFILTCSTQTNIRSGSFTDVRLNLGLFARCANVVDTFSLEEVISRLITQYIKEDK